MSSIRSRSVFNLGIVNKCPRIAYLFYTHLKLKE
uniref:Uncharacterized protein n=1 Tax=Rhizophora mucronata TaxID=61149 RepID=A0A2P2MZF5_RHIMU